MYIEKVKLLEFSDQICKKDEEEKRKESRKLR